MNAHLRKLAHHRGVVSAVLIVGLMLWSCAAAGALSILVYDSGSYNTRAVNAMGRLGYPYTLTNDLSTSLAEGTWDLVVVDSPSASMWGVLNTHIAAGGRVLLSTWDLGSIDADLATAMGVTSSASLSAPQDIYRWSTTHLLFTSPCSVPDLQGWADNWGTNGDWLTVNSGTAVAGFTATETAGVAAIVIGNGGRTIVNSFLWDDSTGADSDADGIPDIEELIVNEVQFLYAPSAGTVQVDAAVYAAIDAVQLKVIDGNAGADPDTPDTVTVSVTSSTETTPETVTLTETTPAGGEFVASLDLATGSPAADGTLQVADGDTITVTYIDADDGQGGTNLTRTATAVVDGAAPTFAGLTSATGGDQFVDLAWSAATDASSPIAYNIYRAETAGGQQFDLPPHARTTELTYHDVTDVFPNATYYYVVRAEDPVENMDTNTVEHSATVLGPVKFFSEYLDTDPGWTCEGQWAFGPPTGGGDLDPTAGYTGDNVYGYNLDGNYPDEMSAQYLTSAAIDCSGYMDVQLRFKRWLGVESSAYDHAAVEASTDGTNWTVIWEHVQGDIGDYGWVDQEWDLPFAADQPTVYLRWKMGPTDTSVTYCGWNIDDIELWGVSTGGNHAPVLSTIGNRTVDETQPLAFNINATDPDGDTLTYSATGLPSGATLNPTTGAFSWMPWYGDAGDWPIRFEVSDGMLTDYEDVVISVYGTNHPPVLDAVGNKSVNEGQTLTINLNATDPEGDTITYLVSGDPLNSTFDQTTGAFSFTPDYTQAGTISVQFSASDGEYTDSEDITITVNEVTDPPVLDAIDNRDAYEGTELSFSLSATDPDGDSVTYSATGLPTGATLNATTGAFAWTPGYDQAGAHEVTFTASDGTATDSETITITVYNVNRPPVLDPIGAKTVNEGELLTFTLTGSDPDGDTVSFYMQDEPSGATINYATGVFSWTPGYLASGTHTLRFTAFDGADADGEDVTITVNDVDQPPVLSPIGDRTIGEGEYLAFTVSANDPDGEPVTRSATGVPAGATFDPTTGHFYWTPTYEQAGSYPVHFEATSGGLTDSEDITITVTNVVANVTVARFAAPATAAAGRSKTISAVIKNGSVASDVTVVFSRVSPDAAELSRQTIQLAANAKKTVSFTYTFRTADAPSTTFRVAATTPSGGSTSAQDTTRVR